MHSSHIKRLMMDSLEKRTKMDVAKPKKLFFIQILLTYGT